MIAEIYYGYNVIVEEEDIERIKDLAEKTDINLVELDKTTDKNNYVLGKQIKELEVPNVDKINSEKIIKEIVGIEYSEELEEIEDTLETKEKQSMMMLVGRNKE